MQVQFTAKAYISPYTRMEDVVNGSEIPLLTNRDSSYFEKEGYPQIGVATVTIELFSDDEITSKKLEALQAQLHTVRAENQQRENAILDQISKLQAITYTPEA